MDTSEQKSYFLFIGAVVVNCGSDDYLLSPHGDSIYDMMYTIKITLWFVRSHDFGFIGAGRGGAGTSQICDFGSNF